MERLEGEWNELRQGRASARPGWTRMSRRSSLPIFSMNAARIFYHLVVRDALRHPVLTSINILSVALGVAVYLAIQVTNYSANRALAASVDVTAGRANLGTVGANDDANFSRIQNAPGRTAATPSVA